MRSEIFENGFGECRSVRWGRLLPLLVLLAVSGIFTPAEAQFSNGYSFRREVNLVDAQVAGGSHTNFPVLVDINTIDFPATAADLRTTANGGKVVNANGYDIIFTSDLDGTVQLAHEIERYVATTGEILFWVRIESLVSTTSIYMFYGNSSIATFQGDVTSNGVAGVWENGYEGVWHLKENPSGSAPQIADSTSNNNDGTMNGGMTTTDQVAGQIDGSLDFDGSNDWFNLGNDPGLRMNQSESMTFSAWVNTRSLTSTQNILRYDDGDLSDGDNPIPRNIYMFRVDNNQVTFSFGTVPGGLSGMSRGPIALNTWHHVVAVRDVGADTQSIYIDGVQAGAAVTDTTTGVWETTGQYAMMGRWHTIEFFNGLIDELRVSSVARSGTWIQTEYNNQLSPPGFYVLGAEMTATTVNSTGDAVDLVAGDGKCDTGALNSQGAPECTLRAAIEEANALAGADTIRFNIPTTEPGYSAAPLSYTIQPGSALPLITEQLDILGN